MRFAWFLLLSATAAFAADDSSRVVVKVNGVDITAGDVEFAMMTRQIMLEDRAARESQLIDDLIDRQLIRGFLVRRKITAPADDLAYQIQVAEDAIKRAGDDPAKLLPKLGYSSERLKSELGLPLAWQVYVRQTITLPQTKEYFDRHKVELDGTQLKGRQIFLKLPPKPTDSDVATKTNQLKDIKAQIESGKISFADAARKYSESPSKEQGGDVGQFGFRGKLPTPIVQAAFRLKVNEISQPVVSAFGVHLMQVTERLPGDLSLEDVRPVIIERLSDQLWKDTVARERQSSKIERAR